MMYYLVIMCTNVYEKLTKSEIRYKVQIGSNITQNYSSNP